jgi:hypothetical protein
MPKWRCTHGHRWTTDADFIDAIAAVFGVSIGDRKYCARCVREWMDAHWGQVRADD